MGASNKKDAQNKWFRLDNAGKLYPAVATSTWSSVFRISAELHSPIQPGILQKAVARVLPRFPSMGVRLRRGFFWYYFEENQKPLIVREEVGHPCMRFRWSEENGYLLRVLYYQRRISVEFFHSVTDGGGGFVFLKTLVAEYLRLLGRQIPAGEGVLDIKSKPTRGEVADDFLRAPLPRLRAKRGESAAYHIKAQMEPPHTLYVIVAEMPLSKVQEKARALDVTVTEYVAAAQLFACYQIFLESGERPRPIRVSVPVNMRKFFPSETLRNFSSFVNVEIDPRLGEYTFEEVALTVKAFMRYAVNPKKLFAGIASNVANERNWLIRLCPLPIKNFVINMVFRYLGDRAVTSVLTSMGRVSGPAALMTQISRFEVMLGGSASPVCNAALVTTGDLMRLTFSRNMQSAALPYHMLRVLIEQGIPVTVSSNHE